MRFLEFYQLLRESEKPMFFIGTCVGLEEDDLLEFDDSAKEISARTFAKYIGPEQWKEWRKAYGVPLDKDYHVTFERGLWKGNPAVCFHHSAIHHIFATSDEDGRWLDEL